jgi:FtsZ-binding cell division protein ZapB
LFEQLRAKGVGAVGTFRLIKTKREELDNKKKDKKKDKKKKGTKAKEKLPAEAINARLVDLRTIHKPQIP